MALHPLYLRIYCQRILKLRYIDINCGVCRYYRSNKCTKDILRWVVSEFELYWEPGDRAQPGLCQGGQTTSVIIGEKKHGHLINSYKSEFYPNISALLQILKTLPCTTTTEERSFRTLRRINRFLRSGRSQSCDRGGQRKAIVNILILRNICENLIILNESLRTFEKI